MKWLKKCNACKRTKAWFLVKYQTIKVPYSKVTAKSKEELCGKCIKQINTVLQKSVV